MRERGDGGGLVDFLDSRIVRVKSCLQVIDRIFVSGNVRVGEWRPGGALICVSV